MNPALTLTFYGDDFTGSTDAMEALALAGLRTILFLRAPGAHEIATRYADVKCIGVAGTSRAMSPAEMDAKLAPVLEALWSLGAPLLHYKVCSTFDSAPQIGSIGHVVDFARLHLNAGRTVPIVAGSPPLRRYTVFGNHFAAAGEAVHRLDRHPTMARHPVTPMHEADLKRHLAAQTKPEAATQWSTRTLAAVAGVSDTTVQRIWRTHGLKPHRVKRFKVSRDPDRAWGNGSCSCAAGACRCGRSPARSAAAWRRSVAGWGRRACRA